MIVRSPKFIHSQAISVLGITGIVGGVVINSVGTRQGQTVPQLGQVIVVG